MVTYESKSKSFAEGDFAADNFAENREFAKEGDFVADDFFEDDFFEGDFVADGNGLSCNNCVKKAIVYY
jgi:hypothetical protein